MNLRDLNSSLPSDDTSCKWGQFYLCSYSNIQHLWMTLIQLLFIYCSHLKIQLTMTLTRVKWVAIFRKRRGGAISKISLNWRQSACVELAIIKIEFAAYWPYFNGKCNQRVWRRQIKNTSERQAGRPLQLAGWCCYQERPPKIVVTSSSSIFLLLWTPSSSTAAACVIMTSSPIPQWQTVGHISHELYYYLCTGRRRAVATAQSRWWLLPVIVAVDGMEFSEDIIHSR